MIKYDLKYIIGTQITYAKTKIFYIEIWFWLECGTNQDEIKIKSGYYQTTGLMGWVFNQKKKLSHSQKKLSLTKAFKRGIITYYINFAFYPKMWGKLVILTLLSLGSF